MNAAFIHFLYHQDDIPELQEFFLVNITSAVLITTLSTDPQLGMDYLIIIYLLVAEFHTSVFLPI